MIWKLQHRQIDLEHVGLIMGVLNVTPDSFSDPGLYFAHDKAFAHAEEMISQGADILDIGGESSRPGSDPVPLNEELRRVIPIIEKIRSAFPKILISIDTYKAETARQAIAAGANLVNDISALQHDPKMLEVVKRSDAGLIIMHMRGTPKTMQINPHYKDPTAEIFQFLKHRIVELTASGLNPACIAIDPGFGFGKQLKHNLDLLRNLKQFTLLGNPLVVGVSRKSMIAALLSNPKETERLWPTVGLTSFMREHGARIFRVHDVGANREALRMTEAILAHD